MRFEQALQAMRIGKVVYNKQEPDIKYGMDDLLEKKLWYECKGQKEILSEDWEFVK